MNIFIIVIVVLVFIGILLRFFVVFDSKIKFFASGFDFGFKLSEINLLWKLAKKNKLEDPETIFVSTQILNKCISALVSDAKLNGMEFSARFQNFLSRLYKFRTKIAFAADNKRGVDSTKSINNGQKISIILKGNGVFYSKVINNGHELSIKLPVQYNEQIKSHLTLPAEDWKGRSVSIYFNRKGDACYAFDTEVLANGFFAGTEVLFLKHSYELQRIQKRQSIRVACEIYAMMFILRGHYVNYDEIEDTAGYRCLLEDISSEGALIRIGGRGEKNVQLKLQFNLDDQQIIMFGIVRAVEYNSTLDQSRLHFECVHTTPSMHNKILAFVYNILPQNEKDVQNALQLVDDDSEVEKTPPEENSEIAENANNAENPESSAPDANAENAENPEASN